MPKEYELRYINYKKADIIKKLKSLGAKQIHKPMIYEYTVFAHPIKKDQADSYIRVRKEFNKISLTYKDNLKSKYVDEYETLVSDYESTIDILYKMGLKKKYSIQKLREKWSIKGCKEIVFDTYPALPDYMEIECDSVENIKKLEKKLGLSEEKIFHAGSLYKDLYNTSDRNSNNDLTFETVKKVIKPYIRKNHKLFNQIVNQQLKYIKSLD